MDRQICSIAGCNNLTTFVKRYKDKTYYRKLCQSHHKQKYNVPDWKRGLGSRNQRQQKENQVYDLKFTPCIRCGWNKSYCHLHRILPGNQGGQYVKENIMVLCPNCHQLEHLGSFPT